MSRPSFSFFALKIFFVDLHTFLDVRILSEVSDDGFLQVWDNVRVKGSYCYLEGVTVFHLDPFDHVVDNLFVFADLGLAQLLFQDLHFNYILFVNEWYHVEAP